MRVSARAVNWADCPASAAPHAVQSQTFVTVGREYEVHAMAVFNGNPLLQVVDDLGLPAWKSVWLFQVVSHDLPDDWLVSLFRGEPAVVFGPEFLVRDEDTYSAMVELDSGQVARFWSRIDARAGAQNVEVGGAKVAN